MPTYEKKKPGLKVCIVGGGFSGLCGAIKLLREIGTENFEIFESNKDFGGTWFLNKYPGCACDIPIHAYCFSFERRADWRAQYASNFEIQKYLKEVAVKYDLYSKTNFEHTVKRLEWDDNLKQWIVTIRNNRNGNVFSNSYDVVFNATGSIRVPKIPEEFQGFQGPILHTASWDESVDICNKRVGVVGVGASGIQVIPQVSKLAKELVVFQRKPSWISPKYDFEFSDFWKKLFSYFPFVLMLYNMLLFYTFELLYLALKKGTWANRQGAKLCNWHRRQQLAGRPDLYEKLTPKYDFGCQRTAFASDYYPVFAKPNTMLITDKIASVKDNSIITESGQQIDVDVLVLATGFRITDYFSPMEIIDRNGNDVLTYWKKETPSLFMGIVSHNLPNLFILYGPNTSTGHNSVVVTVEFQMDFVLHSLKEMMKREAKVVTIKASAETKYMDELQERFRIMVWSASLCSPWYTDEKGRNVSIFPWSLTSYRRRVRDFNYQQLLDFQ